MRTRQNEDARTDSMLVATKQAIEASVVHNEVDKLSGHARELLGELRALVGISDLTRLAAIKVIQQIKQECLDRRINWEQVCAERLPKCRRSIDHYLETLETFGDGMYETIIDITNRAERVHARRLLKGGGLRLDGDCIIIEDRRIRNVPEEAHTILEIVRESMAREEAAKADAANEKAARKRDSETHEKREQALHELLEKKAAEVARMNARPAPKEFKTEADRKRWQTLCAVRNEIEVAVGQLRAVFLDEDTTLPTWREAETLIGLGQYLFWEAGKELLELHGDVLGQFAALEPPVPFPMGDWPERDARGLPIATAPALALHSGNSPEIIDHPAA